MKVRFTVVDFWLLLLGITLGIIAVILSLGAQNLEILWNKISQTAF